MSQYCISDHCRWVKGSRGSAIYDLKTGVVHALNAEETFVIEQLLFVSRIPDGAEAFVKGLLDKFLLNNHDTPLAEKRIVPSLRYVWLELTVGCNCRCLHCYGAFGISNQQNLRTELTTQEWKKIINRIISLGGREIQLIGGEPLIHPDFCEILSYAHSVGIQRIDIFTNATLLTETIADLIAEVKASVRVSIYGCDAATHDAITRNSGSFSRLDRGLNLLREREIPTTPAVVLMRENQDILPQIKQYIESKGLKFQGFDTVRTVTHSTQDSHTVTRREIARKRIICEQSFKTSPYSFSCSRQWNNCWFGKFAVTSYGDIIPCIFARDLICGNLRTDSYNIIWEKLLGYWRITKDEVSICRECEFRYSCEDCRPLAMGEGTGLYGKYPRCTYVPSDCRWEIL